MFMTLPSMTALLLRIFRMTGSALAANRAKISSIRPDRLKEFMNNGLPSAIIDE